MTSPKRDGANFAAHVERYRDAILAARDLMPGAKVVGLVMLGMANRNIYAVTGRLVSWLAESTIAARSSIPVGSVRRHREALRAAGYVTSKVRGRGSSAEYTFNSDRFECVEEPRADERLSKADNRSYVSGNSADGIPLVSGNFSDERAPVNKKPLKMTPYNRPLVSNNRSPVSPNLPDYLLDDPPEDSESTRCAETRDDDFVEFWGTYPRQSARPSALLAFNHAVKKAAPAELIAAAARFAEACRGMELRYIPFPAKWLEEERWRDQDSMKPPLPDKTEKERWRRAHVLWAVTKNLHSTGPLEPSPPEIVELVREGAIKIGDAARFCHSNINDFARRWNLPLQGEIGASTRRVESDRRVTALIEAEGTIGVRRRAV